MQREGGCWCRRHSVSNLSSLPVTQSPPKGVTIPYRPKPSSSPVIFAGGQVRPLLCSWGVGWGEEGRCLTELPRCQRTSAALRACHPRRFLQWRAVLLWPPRARSEPSSLSSLRDGRGQRWDWGGDTHAKKADLGRRGCWQTALELTSQKRSQCGGGGFESGRDSSCQIQALPLCPGLALRIWRGLLWVTGPEGWGDSLLSGAGFWGAKAWPGVWKGFISHEGRVSDRSSHQVMWYLVPPALS